MAYSRLRREAEKEQQQARQRQVVPPVSPQSKLVQVAARERGVDVNTLLESRVNRRSIDQTTNASWSKDRASLWAITHGLVDTEDNLRPTYSVGARNATGNIEAVDMDSDRYMGNLVPTRKDTARLSDYSGISAELKMAEEEYIAADKRINDYINQNGIQYKSNPGYQTLIYARNQAWGRYHDLKEREELAKYLVEDRADNFKGQYDANRDVGEITEMINLAYNDYLNDPTPEKLEYARQLDELLELYLEKNAAVLDDEGAVATWITKDLAGYMPQFWGQQGSGLKGAAAGGLTVGAATSYIPGVNLGGFVWGARGGYTLGVGKYSYDTMRGAAFRTFINNGVDEETARAAASDEALVSALIEMVDAGVDIATLFTGKIVGTAARKAANVLIRYGINIWSEAAEEAGQELVSISNADRINSGNYDPNAGWFNNSVDLGVDTGKLLGDVITGKNPTARDQALEAAWQGAKLAAMTGGTTMATTSTIDTAIANRVGNQIQSSGGGTVRQFIDLGLAAKPKTESYKIASNLEKKLAAGKQISNTEVGWLYRALQEDKVFDQQPTTNRAQTESEVSREAVSDWGDGRTYTLEQLAREAVAERENGTQSASEGLMELARETVAERNASQQTQAGATQEGDISKRYGALGVKVYEQYVSKAENTETATRQFDTAYKLGEMETPRSKVVLENELQEAAYEAGRLDAVEKADQKAIENADAQEYNGIVNENGTEVLSNGTADQVHLRNSSQRYGSAYPGGEVSGVAESTGGNQSRKAQGRPADSAAASLAYGEAVSTASFGIAGGSNQKTVRLIASADTPAMAAARKSARERGLRVTFFAGNNLDIVQTFKKADGSTGRADISARAFITGDRVFVRVDHPRYTADQIMRHEIGHDMIAKGEVDPNTVRERINEKFGEEKAQQLADMYTEAYEGSGMTPDQIWDEVICDSLGDMNIFTDTVHEGDAWTLLSETKKASADAKTENVRGPPTSEGKASREWQSYELSDEFARTVKVEDRHAFLRKLANNTKGIRKNKPRRLMFAINDSVYFFTATGYMNGHMESTMPILGNEDMVRQIKEVFYGGVDEGAKVSDSLAEEYRMQRGGNDWDTPHGRHAGEKNSANGLYGEERRNERDGNAAESLDETGGDFEEESVGSLTYDGNGRAYKVESDGTRTYFDTNSDPEARFSMETPVETKKNLVALHNLTEDKLLKSISLGGFPMPSIAVTATDIPHTNFGDITLVMSKTTIDPKFSRKNTVYSADAWTPTFPQIEYEADHAVEKKISSMYYDLAKTHGYDFVKPLYGYAQYLSDELNRQGGVDGIIERRLDDTSMMQVYLAASGKEPVADIKRDVVTRLDQHAVERYDYLIDKLGEDVVNDLIAQGNEHPMEAKKRWVSEHGEELTAAYRGYLSDSGLDADVVENVMEHIKIGEMLREVVGARNYLATGAETVRTETDTAATNEAIRKAAGDGYEAWLRDLFSGAVKDTGIYNNKELYTPSGNRRSFSQTHYPVTLDNISKAMAAQNDGNSRNVSGFYGVKSLRAGTAKRFSSIKEMHDYEGRLKHLTQEEADEINEALSKRMNDLIERIYDTKEHGKYSNSFMGMDAIGNMLMEMAELKTKTIDSLSKKSAEWHYQLNNGILADIRDLLFDVSQMPVNIFEAKPERSVRFDEVLAAVLPDDVSKKLRDALEAQGVSVLTYEKGNDASRMEAVNSVDGAQFSRELASVEAMRKENAKLKEVNEALREQFKRTEFAQVDKKSLDKFTKALLKDYQSGADINEIRDALSDVYTYMANGEDGQSAAWNDLQERAYNVAVSILESASAINDDMYQEYKSLRDRLRNYPISIDKRYNNDIQGYESIEAFRRANFGRIKIANDGTPVDIVYSDLANTYPWFFDESEYTTQADQLTHIADVLASLQPYEVNPYSSNMRQAATWLASDILERFYELPQAKPTFADKQAAKLTKQVIKDAKKLEKLREQKNTAIKDAKLAGQMAQGRVMAKQLTTAKMLIEKARANTIARVEKEKADKRAAVKKVREYYKAKENKASESRKARTLRAKIMRHAQEMSRKLLRPTDKQHIPQKLQGAVAKLLEAINLESNYEMAYGTDAKYHRVKPGTVLGAEATNRTKAFAELRKLYAEMANELVIDPDLLGEDGLLSDVAALADKRIADMTSKELETVYQTLRAIEATVSSANKAFAESRWASIEEAAESIREENKNKRQVTEYAGPIGWGQKLTGLDMMTPSAFFHRLGESGDAIFRMMRNAQDKHIQLMKAVADFIHKELDAVPVKKWEKELHTVKLGGEDVQLTTAQIMELYVLTKRKQAQDHIFMGGILPESVANKGIKKIARAEPVRGIQISEVSEAISKLTEEQKKVADKLQEYASTELSKWGNEAAMQVYNYEKFNEEVYWPIRSNRQEITSTVEKDTQVTSVAGRGFSKNTKPNANTSVKIGSIFDTFATHSSEMATYAAWLAPAEDINRIRNYTFMSEEGGRAGTVKGIIERVHGSRGTQYLQKLLSDIANGVGAGRGNETRMDQIIGNYKASAIGANLRVIIQQPTSLLRALDMIDPQHLLTVKNPMSGWKKAKKYAPIAQWKDWGYFDINTGRQMKDVLFETDSALDKAKQFTMAGAGLADSISWGTLWNAVENEVAATRKELKPNTEEFYKAVAARFTEIVDHTQVVDGILQRSQIMRSADGLTKMATSFMGEPTKQYNMVMTALYDFRHTEGKERTIARKRFGRTMTALVISGVVNAMAQSIIDAVRDDDEEKEYWEKWLTAFFGLKGDEETIGEKAKAIIFGSNLANIFNPAGYIPYAKDVVSLLAGYDVSRMDMESIEKTISSWNNLWKAINGEGGYTIQGAAINFIGEAARLFGVPVANIKREIVSFTTMTAQETDSFMMQYYIEKFFTNVNNSSGGSMNILYNAYKEDKDEFEALYARMLKDDLLKTEDKTTAEVIAGKLQSKLVKDLYELYKTDPKAYEEMYDDLVERDFLKTGVKSSDPEKDTFVSTEEHIASAMESLMKKDQGVDKVSDLESRYFGPDQQREYDQKMREIQSNSVWRSATEEQREKVEDNLRGIVLGSDSKMLETIEEGAPYGLDDTEYLLYKLALETVDQPNENGKFGTYTNEEKARAFASMNLGDGEMAFLWGTDQALEAYAYGIDMEKYITFKAAIGNIVADKDRRGNTISGSRRKKIIAYLRSLGVSQKEYWYLLGTEYDLKDDPNYRRYFGR